MHQITLQQAMQLAIDHHLAGRFPQAQSLYRQILSVAPDHVEALHNLGAIALQMHQIDSAVKLLTRTVELSPHHFDAHTNLTFALVQAGQFERAVNIGKRAVTLRPDDAGALNNLGTALRENNQLDQAIDCFQRAITLDQNFAEACNNLALAHQAAGQMEHAIEMYLRALRLNPNLTVARDSLVMAAQYRQPISANVLREIGRNTRPIESADIFAPHPPRSIPQNQRLRVGYVSPDFRNHSVARFILPLLMNHDPNHFEITCYSNVEKPDEMTGLLQTHTHHWQNIFNLNDTQAAELIQHHSIDILVDLAMHTPGNRLGVFAIKPAPLQLSYLAYAGGPAVPAIDFHLSDSYLEPAGLQNQVALQPPAFLDGSYWCYQQTFTTPPVNSLPALTAGHITFGCLNNFCKLSDDALYTWARLMNQVPHSRLLLHSPPGRHRDRLLDFMSKHGVQSDRIKMVGWLFAEEYFQLYQQVDIALDPFPFAGGTTTCDALWMGVPVITLAGTTAVGRSGISILSNAQTPQWIADSPDHYIEIGTTLAVDHPHLNQLRLHLREKIKSSPLMDAKAFTRSIEAVYRELVSARNQI